VTTYPAAGRRKGRRPFVVAIDIGSTGVRAGRFTSTGELAGSIARARYREHHDTAVGHPAVASVLTAVLGVLAEVDTSDVAAVATSAVWHTLVPVADASPAGSTACTWEASPRPGTERSERTAALRTTAPRDVTGAYVHHSYPAAMLASLPATPDRYCDLGSLVLSQLCGFPPGWSESIAAGSGLWDQAHRTWHLPALKALGVSPEQLGGLWRHARRCRPGTRAAALDLAETLWLPPIGDGLCHNLGQGAVGPGRLAVTVGTSGSVRTVLATAEAITVRSGLWHYRSSEQSWAIGGAVTSAGNVLEWVEKFTGGSIDWDRLTAFEGGLTDLRAIPDVFGRRGPDYPWDATGALIGLRPQHTLEDVRQAVAVDVWRTFADLFRRLHGTYAGQATAVAAGGVIRHHPAAGQLLADALNMPIGLTDCPEPTLRGAALYGCQSLANGEPALDDTVRLIGLGYIASPRTNTTYLPRPGPAADLAVRWGRPMPITAASGSAGHAPTRRHGHQEITIDTGASRGPGQLKANRMHHRIGVRG
jgi:gluconokinase